MKRAARTLLLLALAALAGVVASEAIYRSSSAQRALARLCGVEQARSAVGSNLRAAAAGEPVADAEIERELNLLHDQFGDDEILAQALASFGLSLGTLRDEVTDHLRARHWIEKRIAPQLQLASEELRRVYRADDPRFLQPPRYRASHIFLAAPDGSAPELIAEKQSAIQGLAIRLLANEPFAQLAAEASEDEATKFRGGDLNYFAANRVPPEFFAEVEKVKPGQISAPFRSHLGFHIIQLSEAKSAEAVSSEEAQSEIGLELTNQKRAGAIAQLTE